MAGLPRVSFTYIEFDVAEIHDEVLFAPGGDIYEWTHDVASELQGAARRGAPPLRSHSRWGHRGTGRLAAGITGRATTGITKTVDIVLNSSAPYTMYVHGGTRGPIYSNLGWLNRITVDSLVEHGDTKFKPPASMTGLFMSLPPSAGAGGSHRFHMVVSGQAPNPFLARAFNQIAREHPAINPLYDPYPEAAGEGPKGFPQLARPEYRRQVRLRKLRREQEERAKRKARRRRKKD